MLLFSKNLLAIFLFIFLEGIWSGATFEDEKEMATFEEAQGRKAIKRGQRSTNGNEYKQSIQVSSGILRLEESRVKAQTDTTPNVRPWKHADGVIDYAAWLDPSRKSGPESNSQTKHTENGFNELLDAQVYIADGSVFSRDTQRNHHLGQSLTESVVSSETSSTLLNGHPAGPVLHTQIASSTNRYQADSKGIVTGNVNFGNDDDKGIDLRNRHSGNRASYGR